MNFDVLLFLVDFGAVRWSAIWATLPTQFALWVPLERVFFVCLLNDGYCVGCSLTSFILHLTFPLSVSTTFRQFYGMTLSCSRILHSCISEH